MSSDDNAEQLRAYLPEPFSLFYSPSNLKVPRRRLRWPELWFVSLRALRGKRRGSLQTRPTRLKAKYVIDLTNLSPAG